MALPPTWSSLLSHLLSSRPLNSQSSLYLFLLPMLNPVFSPLSLHASTGINLHCTLSGSPSLTTSHSSLKPHLFISHSFSSLPLPPPLLPIPRLPFQDPQVALCLCCHSLLNPCSTLLPCKSLYSATVVYAVSSTLSEEGAVSIDN